MNVSLSHFLQWDLQNLIDFMNLILPLTQLYTTTKDSPRHYPNGNLFSLRILKNNSNTFLTSCWERFKCTKLPEREERETSQTGELPVLGSLFYTSIFSQAKFSPGEIYFCMEKTSFLHTPVTMFQHYIHLIVVLIFNKRDDIFQVGR